VLLFLSVAPALAQPRHLTLTPTAGVTGITSFQSEDTGRGVHAGAAFALRSAAEPLYPVLAVGYARVPGDRPGERGGGVGIASLLVGLRFERDLFVRPFVGLGVGGLYTRFHASEQGDGVRDPAVGFLWLPVASAEAGVRVPLGPLVAVEGSGQFRSFIPGTSLSFSTVSARIGVSYTLR
jgi:hypothetical protein